MKTEISVLICPSYSLVYRIAQNTVGHRHTVSYRNENDRHDGGHQRHADRNELQTQFSYHDKRPSLSKKLWKTRKNCRNKVTKRHFSGTGRSGPSSRAERSFYLDRRSSAGRRLDTERKRSVCSAPTVVCHGRGALILGLPASGGPSKELFASPQISTFGVGGVGRAYADSLYAGT